MPESISITFETKKQKQEIISAIAQNHNYQPKISDPINLDGSFIENPETEEKFAERVIKTFIFENIRKVTEMEIEAFKQKKQREAEAKIKGVSVG